MQINLLSKGAYEFSHSRVSVYFAMDREHVILYPQTSVRPTFSAFRIGGPLHLAY